MSRPLKPLKKSELKRLAARILAIFRRRRARKRKKITVQYLMMLPLLSIVYPLITLIAASIQT